MSTAAKNKTRINVRLPFEMKEVLKEAAAIVGQSVDDFAASSVLQSARKVIDQRNGTHLSNRDRDLFIELLDAVDAKPNKALRDAATRYNKQLGLALQFLGG